MPSAEVSEEMGTRSEARGIRRSWAGSSLHCVAFYSAFTPYYGVIPALQRRDRYLLRATSGFLHVGSTSGARSPHLPFSRPGTGECKAGAPRTQILARNFGAVSGQRPGDCQLAEDVTANICFWLQRLKCSSCGVMREVLRARWFVM